MRRRTAPALVPVVVIALLAGAFAVESLPGAGAAPATTSSQLNGVWCTSSTNCFAVGSYGIASLGQVKTLAERWNGITWSIVPSRNSPGTTSDRLSAITCTSATECTAVGQQITDNPRKTMTLVEHWNGKSWSVVASPNSTIPGSLNGLAAVSCVSPAWCVAVGTDLITKAGNVVETQELLERWDGETWSMGRILHIPDTHAYSLSGVSCTSKLNCFAVGSYNNPNHVPGSTGLSTLVERWNGNAWHLFAGPSADMGQGAGLASVSCTGAPNCVAAGSYALGNLGQPDILGERWDGHAWSMVTKFRPGNSSNALNGISCLSAALCFAAGYTETDSGNTASQKPLLERWNGTALSVVPSANAATPQNQLAAVHCSSASRCMAVGAASTATAPFGAGPYTTLAERWDGKTWSVVATANP